MNPPAGEKPIEVLVVDDSAVIRRFVTEVLTAESDICVSATAGNGQLALDRLADHLPDVVVLDIEMPVLDGLATLERIRRRWRELPVIMFSTLTTRGATATLDALAAGATDYVSKPTHLGDLTTAKAVVGRELVPAIRSCATVHRMRQRLGRPPLARTTAPVPGSGQPHFAAATPRAPFRPRPAKIDVVVIASSTGGPHALTEVIPRLPADIGVPVLVVQHMPELFTRLLAERLDSRSVLSVHHAEEALALEPGHVYLAPGGRHLLIRRSADGRHRTGLDDGPAENSVRPAADVLFRSAAALYGSRVLAVVLTGMGSDGLAGARAIHQGGGIVFAQDEASSVVWGMPGAISREGLADAELPLEEIAPMITKQLGALQGAVA